MDRSCHCNFGQPALEGGIAADVPLFNAALGVLSPNLHTPPSPNPFIRSERVILAGIKGSSQYFDRDTAKAMANLGFVILGEFSDKPDIDKTMAELEKASQKYLP